MRDGLTWGGVLCLISIMATLSVSQTGSQETGDQLSNKGGVDLVRRINTAEAEFFFKTHGYVSLDKLIEHRFFRNGSPTVHTGTAATSSQDSSVGNEVVPTLIDSASGSLGNHKIFVIASADGRHYQVGVVPTEPKCGPALFSDESGVIYPANALGCPPGETVHRSSDPL